MKKLFKKIVLFLTKRKRLLENINQVVTENSLAISKLLVKINKVEERINQAIPDITINNSLLELKEEIKGINNYVYNDLKTIIKKSQSQAVGFGFGGNIKENK